MKRYSFVYQLGTVSVLLTTLLLPINSVYDNSTVLSNPSFETGDLTGWTVINGNLFSDDSVINNQTWWNEKIPYNKDDVFHLDGWGGVGEAGTGTLRSSVFTLDGSGFITFKLGGGKDSSKVCLIVK